MDKWQTALAQSDIKYKVFNLKRESDESHGFYSYDDDFKDVTLKIIVPVPDDKTHTEYKEIISVPRFDLISHPISELHLWYLIDDVKILYSCLIKGINSWGQLKSWHVDFGEKIEDLDVDSFRQIENRVMVLEKFQELYKIGRHTVIDSEVLRKSEAITPNFFDAVSEKLKEFNGNPKLLLNALREGQFPRFQTAKIDLFEEYLLKEGYIDDGEPKSTDEILTNIQLIVSEYKMDIESIDKFIKRVL